MVTFCKQDESQKMHDYMIGLEEKIWQDMKIPYRKVNVCS
jgi:seryl-tRNA synthetase